jgi:hypothetical protein
MNFQIGFIMSYWEKMVWYIWGYDGLIIGWFDAPKKSHEFLKKVLNVLLTNIMVCAIMQRASGTKMDPSQ